MGLLEKIKQDVQKQGTNKSKLFYVRDGGKARIRFLQEIDEGMEVVIHDSFDRGINVICQKQLNKDCPYCEDDELRTRNFYCWSVWDYEANEVKLFIYPVNNCSPLPALLALYDTYGTITDRDYVISVQGKQQNKSFTVIPMDKVKFRNEKAKPYSTEAVWKILSKAYPCPDSGSDSDDESKEDKASKYEGKSPVELYKLCISRAIEAEKKKPANYYINLLVEADEATDDWGDAETEAEEDEDDWAEEE